MKNALIIGGASSGSGKTTFSIGLMKALLDRGIDVQPYKVGPDYIDPMFHRHVTRRSSYNLPVWMVPDETIKYLFAKRLEKRSFAVIEGVMGYYDGKMASGIEGSTAYLAQLLDVPALIIFDASSMALSAAAIVHGFSTFVEKSMIKGVVLNNVASEMHYQLLKSGIESHTGVKCYGYLKKDPNIHLGSRHLGLLQAQEIDNLDEKVAYISKQIDMTVDVEGLIKDFNFDFEAFNQSLEKQTVAHSLLDSQDSRVRSLERLDESIQDLKSKVVKMGGLKIGIAQDKAFSFYYDENLETLREIGIDLIPFSPLEDKEIPKCDGLYIGGGYPEVFSHEISGNLTMLASIRHHLESGMPCYAECGGLMFLTNSITSGDQPDPMVGFFDAKSEMTTKLQRFGLIEVNLEGLLGQSMTFRAHEFHKSKIEDLSEIQKLYKVSKGTRTWTCGYYKNNTLATYAHHHFYANINFLSLLIDLWGIMKA